MPRRARSTILRVEVILARPLRVERLAELSVEKPSGWHDLFLSLLRYHTNRLLLVHQREVHVVLISSFCQVLTLLLPHHRFKLLSIVLVERLRPKLVIKPLRRPDVRAELLRAYLPFLLSVSLPCDQL